MESILQKIYESLSSFDWVSFLLSIVTIIIAILALIISIITSKHQTRVALFDKRYKIYNELLQFYNLLNIYHDLLEVGDAESFFYAVITYFETIDPDKSASDYLVSIKNIQSDIMAIEILFPKIKNYRLYT